MRERKRVKEREKERERRQRDGREYTVIISKPYGTIKCIHYTI